MRSAILFSAALCACSSADIAGPPAQEPPPELAGSWTLATAPAGAGMVLNPDSSYCEQRPATPAERATLGTPTVRDIGLYGIQYDGAGDAYILFMSARLPHHRAQWTDDDTIAYSLDGHTMEFERGPADCTMTVAEAAQVRAMRAR